MDILEKIKIIVNQLNEWTKAYDEGHPAVSDAEWDNLYFELVDLENKSGIYLLDSPTQKINYQVVNSLEKVSHNHEMLSLDKTKDIEEIKKFVKIKNDIIPHDFLVMCKMDGLTLSVKYQNNNLVSAETRGDGHVGENVLHNAYVIPTIPNRIKCEEELILDGEIICSKADFQEFADEYKNPRNFASGSIRLLNSKECEKRNLTFVVWDVIKGLDDYPDLYSKFCVLKDMGFVVVPFYLNGINDIENLKTEAQYKGYSIDGIVFKFNDPAYGQSLGATSHHFKNAMALKFYDETYTSHLNKIEWTMGRTGTLTPVAVFDPIDMDGSIVERASLHNISIMKQLLGHPYENQKVEIFKANMIIPQVYSAEKAESDVKFLEMPEACPICGERVIVQLSEVSGVENLLCTNSNCEGKIINKFDHFCGKKGLDIKGLSKATLEKLIDWGWIKDLKDIYLLSNFKNEWIKKPGFGLKSVNNILNAIEKSKDCEFYSFISALGIPLIGTTYAKALAKQENNWLDLKNDIKRKFDFSNWDNFGPESCVSLWKYNCDEADELNSILHIKNNIFKDSNGNDAKKSLDGISVVITGKLTKYKNRAALQSDIEAFGGKVLGTVSKNTNYLINNDNMSTSSKNLSAKKLGIPILTEEEFVKKFLN